MSLWSSVCVCFETFSHSHCVSPQFAAAEPKRFDTDTAIKDRQIKRMSFTVGGMRESHGDSRERETEMERGKENKNDGMLVE